MAPDGLSLKLEVRIKWWLVPYLTCLNFMCDMLDREPDQAKLERIINKGISTKAVRC